MRAKSQKRRKFYALIACLTACLVTSLSALGQGDNTALDTSPPVIELETLDNAVADQSQVFTVQIAEDVELQDATFYFRRAGQQPFTAKAMRAIGASGFYSATLRTDPNDLRAIEYYIQARDTSGNRTVSGFAFDPYVRKLSAASVAQEQATPEQGSQSTAEQPLQATSTPFYKKRWVQIAFGVVAAGVIASSLNSDGSDTRIAPVNFTLE